MNYMFLPLKRYADFQGRSRRQEFWMFFLFVFIVQIVLLLFLLPIEGSFFSIAARGQTFMALILGLFELAIFIPNLAVQVRRLHDTDRSGWWILLGIVPIVNYIGVFVLLVFDCLEGTKGPNRFGDDPKGQGLTDVFR